MSSPQGPDAPARKTRDATLKRASSFTTTVVLDAVKRWLGLEELSEHEKDVLRRKHERLEAKRQTKRQQLKSRPTKGGKKQEDPIAKRLLHEIKDIEKEQKRIRKRIGEEIETERPRSRRRRSG